MRDWRAGELRLLAAALVVAVAAVTSVGFFVDRIRLGLERDATQLLGADLVLSSDTPIDADTGERAQRGGLQIARTVTFPSMAISADDADRSVAVGASRRCRPAIRCAATCASPMRSEQDRTESRARFQRAAKCGSTASLLQALGARAGRRAEARRADVSHRQRSIAIEPDRGTQFINFAPRVMLNLDDLAATQLIANGSRVTYRLLVAGERPAVRDVFGLRCSKQLAAAASVSRSLEGGRPEMQRTLDRAERFLALVALLAAMIAAVAVAAAARRFSLRHLDSCAMMRCLGLAQARHLPAVRARVRRRRAGGVLASAWRWASRRTTCCSMRSAR